MSSISILYKSKISKALFLFPVLFLSIYLQNEDIGFSDLRHIRVKPLLNVFLPIVILITALVITYIKEVPIRVNVVDVALFLFLAFITFNYEIRHNAYNEILVLLGCAAIGTFFAKQAFSERQIGAYLFRLTLFAIAGLGIFEAGYGQLQILGINPVTNAQTIVTGTFFYPGPYAILVSSVLVFCCGILLFSEQIVLADNKWPIRLSGLFLLIALPVIPATQSRSAWLGLLVGVTYLVYVRYKTELTRYFKNLRKGFVFFMCLSGFVALSVYGAYLLYHFKSESVHGRLRIWEIALRYFAHNPVAGIGHGQFKYEYGKMQSEFIGDRINDPSVILKTDYVKYVFNDFLQILVENGLIGFLLFTGYVFLVVKNLWSDAIREKPYLVSAIGAFGAIMVSCLFSYPLEMPLVLTVLFLFGSIVSCYSRSTLFTIEAKSIGLDIVLLAGLFCSLNLFQKELAMTKARDTEWVQGVKLYEERKFEASIPHFETAAKAIPGDPEITMAYGRALYMTGNYEESECILEELATRIQDPMVHLNLGDAYLQRKKYALAEQAYRTSVSISPDRLYPRYRLVQLHKEVGNKESAKQEASLALKLRIPVSSPASDTIRARMYRMLSE